ncbi:MAG TPA: hypothetical protein VN522_00065 [Solirubrobacterales bacterium]|nr:hypothetical protein [Solirubrobacterales bacterium]
MSGTRGGLGRIVAMAIGLAVLLALAVTSEARGGAYRIAQCGWGIGAELDPTYPATEGTAFSVNPAACSPPPGSGPAGMRFEGAIAADGALGLARARWIAPAGTTFRAARLSWSGNPQPGNWQGVGVDVGSQFHILASSFAGLAPATVDLPIAGAAWAFEAWLQCLVGGPVVGCTRSVASTMSLSGLTFTLEDGQQPQARLGGALLAGGWHRGTAALELAGTDVGAGLVGGAVAIDGATVLTLLPACAVQTIEGEPRGVKMQPCPSSANRSVDVDTTRLADGDHTLRGCATDFAGNQACAPDVAIEVDNTPPATAFVAAAEGRVAATVSDRYSGPAAGTISVRRADTQAWTDLATDLDREGPGAATLTARLPDLSPGTYFLRASAADAAGNTGSTQLRVSGSAAEVRRGIADPHRGGKGASTGGGRSTHLTVHLVAGGRGAGGSGRASTVDYGTVVELRGRLTDAHGDGIEDRPIAVVAREAAGIGRAPERRRVATDRGGRFEVRLPPGTSRRLSVAFRGGGGFAPARRSLALRVRAAISLVADPTELHTGESIRLSGRVHLGPAHVSGHGKLVAIQYLERATGRWRPALVVRTDAKGRFETSYRFRYVTGVARIRLRATAPAEGGWPFARGSSSPVTITVSSG